MSEKYDSREDTEAHIANVRSNILDVIVADLIQRAAEHDASKLGEPEKPIFDEVTGRLKGLTYGSEEYTEQLKEMKVALDHHYANNRHHPEHFKNRVEGMTLVDIIEMFCDWSAATHRHADGDIGKSINHNAERFGYGSTLGRIFVNTAKEYGMGKNCDEAFWAEPLPLGGGHDYTSPPDDEEDITPPDDDVIEDGFGSAWSAWCPECGKKEMVVVRPGKCQCNNCG